MTGRQRRAIAQLHDSRWELYATEFDACVHQMEGDDFEGAVYVDRKQHRTLAMLRGRPARNTR